MYSFYKKSLTLELTIISSMNIRSSTGYTCVTLPKQPLSAIAV